MALNFEAFRSHKSKDAYENSGNVHLKVTEYVRGENRQVLAVKGTNIKTGKEEEIKLADANTFARLYVDPTLDMTIRVARAENMLANRAELVDFSAKNSVKHVPVDGVISISDVRFDGITKQQYGRWALGVVNDPNGEAAIGGVIEARKVYVEPDTKAGQSFKPFTKIAINVMQPNLAVSANDVTREKLNKMLAGKLEGTEAPMRTRVAVTISAGDGLTQTAVLASPCEGTKINGFNSIIVKPGIDSVLSRPFDGIAAVAAGVVAGKIGFPFEQLQFGESVTSEQKAMIENGYNLAKNGDLQFSVMPGAAFETFKGFSDAALGLKKDKDGNARTSSHEGAMVDRGYFEGLVGVRFVPAADDQAVRQPTVKSVHPDAPLPNKDRENFLRLDLQSVGQQAFSRVYGLEPATTIPSHDAKIGLGEPTPEEMDDLAYDDNSPGLAM